MRACGSAGPASRRCSRSSARPATWPSASCCRPSTTWPSAACCRPASRWSATPAPRWPTTSSAASPRRPSRPTRARRSTSDFWPAFASMLRYHAGGFDDDVALPRAGRTLEAAGRPSIGTEGNRVFYLSTPSSFFPVIVQRPGRGQAEPAAGARPGRDREAVRPRPAVAPASWPRSCTGRSDERQIYRIDHYLGKETVQNIFAFRFANAIFEPIWNHRYVDHVQITVAESIGRRAPGRLLRGDRRRPRHRPEPPAAGAGAGGDGAAGRLRRRRRCATRRPRLLRAIAADDVRATSVRGQYARGYVAGEEVLGYTTEPQVPRRLDHAHLHRRQARDRQLAVGRARRSTCGPASAWPSA